MNRHKLVKLMHNFSRQEWIEVTLYVKKTLGKSSRDVALFEYMKRYKNNPDSTRLKMEVAQEILAPEIDLKSFSNILYRLTSHIEQYLMLKYLNRPENRIERDVIMARMYKSRGMNDAFISELKSVKRRVKGAKDIDIWKNNHLSRLYYEYYISDAKDESLKKEVLFEGLIHSSEVYDSILALFCKIENVNLQNLLGEDWQLEMPSFFDNADLLKKTETTELLHYALAAARDKNEANYQQLKSGFLQQKDLLSSDLYFFLLVQLSNLTNHLAKTGLSQYGRDMLEFYDLGLSSGVLLKNNKLSEKRFFNIVDLACKLGEWEWLHIFREEWAGKVETHHQRSIKTLADGYESFAKKHYRNVLKILADSKLYGNVSLTLRTKWLTLCSLYEVYEDEEVTYQYIASFRSYLGFNRKKMMNTTLNGSKNLIKVVELMVSHVNKEKIEAFVENCNVLYYRLWVRDKVQKL